MVVTGKAVKMAASGVFPIVGGFLCDSRAISCARLQTRRARSGQKK